MSASTAATSPNPAQEQLLSALDGRRFVRRTVSFLLGSDEGIRHERRVALTPRHLVRLRHDLEALGLEPRLLVRRGAGERASGTAVPGFSDADYEAVGARVVGPRELSSVGEVDVVHALKEPTDDESHLPPGFLRIGALHLASKPPGVCRLLAKASFAALVDGGTVGNCAYLQIGGDRTPIVGSMSRFAGAVAGNELVAGLTQSGLEGGRVIVVGGGIAGLSAIEKVLAACGELVVVEPFPAAAERVAAFLAERGFERFRIVAGLEEEHLAGAAGILFAHRSGAKAAEKVCDDRQVRRMAKGAAIADIAIDQGGSIAHPDYREEDDAETALAKYRRIFRDFHYYAETNMPREQPREASEMHGDSSLPYVTLLLALSALHGGPGAAAAELLRRDVRVFSRREELADRDIFEAFLQDLRNGVQLVVRDRRVQIAHPDIERDAALSSWIAGCCQA